MSKGNTSGLTTVSLDGAANVNGYNAAATPNAFGAGIGAGMQQVGSAIHHTGLEVMNVQTEGAEWATEAKVNDDYANQYIPKASELRANYDMLRGQDKVLGYDQYVKGLQTLNSDFLASQPNPYGRKLIDSTIKQHTAYEISGAKRELVASQKEFNDQATYDRLQANNSLAADNYNNPAFVQNLSAQNLGLIERQHIDVGYDLNHSQHAAIVQQTYRADQGSMAVGMIERAVQSGDATAANQLRSEYATVIPGYQQLKLDNTLHVLNMQHAGSQTVSAFSSGMPMPPVVGAPAAQTQALVANTAKARGVDLNEALTVLQIESANGQNRGARGTLGQDKESAGKPDAEQAISLCDNWDLATGTARNSLGREPLGWEKYVVYQQGAGGGPALLHAAQDAPDKRAVDVLAPLYKNRDDALDAVIGNGGNASMTAQDFVDHISKVYQSNAKKSYSEFGDSELPGNAILAPHQDAPPAVQPGATPMQALLNFNSKVPQLLAQINGIPNVEVREGVMKAFKQDHAKYQEAATAYQTVLVNQAGQLMANPTFTSMDQVPAEMYAALATDHPQTLMVMEKRAEANANRNTAAPLDFAKPEMLGSQIAARVSAAKIRSADTGKPLQIFTDHDKKLLASNWEQQSTANRLTLLNDLHENLPDGTDYRDVVQQIKPDSPVTAIAGGFVGLKGQTLAKSGFFSSGDIYVTPQVVAQKLLEGEELLNPSKTEKKENGTGKVFPMPSDESDVKGLRPGFNSYVGDAFRGNATAYSYAYQAYRAYYAAEASQRGVYSTELDDGIAEVAMRSVLGTVVDKNGAKTLAPWGMSESDFNDVGKVQFEQTIAANGYDPAVVQWRDVKLQNKIGQQGAYFAMIGAGYLLDKKGRPLTINILKGGS